MGKFLLDDRNMHNYTAKGEAGAKWGDVWLGRCVFVQALTQGGKYAPTGVDINPTGPPGYCQGIFYGLAFEVGKDGWRGRQNVREWMDISPASPQHYQGTQQQRENLEAKIKQGLATIGQSVSDLELVDHDVRKYEEYKDYLDAKKSKDEKTREKGEFALKAVFVDTVDYHAGGGGQGAGRLSMAFMRNNNIMPTIVDDFMRMKSVEDIEKGYLSKLPDVEKRMLQTKWTLYEEWLKLFESAVRKRLERINPVKRSREKTVEEYREWLKPAILHYKLVEDILSDRNKGSFSKDEWKTHFIRTSANAASYNGWTHWIWKSMPDPSPNPAPTELYMKGIMEGEFGKTPFWEDHWTREELIYNAHHGLIADYPWMTYEWIEEHGKDLSKELAGERKPYYTFAKIDVAKSNIKLPSGFEMEDCDFTINLYIMSPNIMLAKQLELAAIKQEMDNYVDHVLGLEPKIEGRRIALYIKEGFKYKVVYESGEHPVEHKEGRHFGSKKEMLEAYPESDWYLSRTYEYDDKGLREHGKIGAFLEDYLGIKFIFGYNRGPYERTFQERMTKFFFKYSQDRFDSICNMIIRRMRIGETP